MDTVTDTKEETVNDSVAETTETTVNPLDMSDDEIMASNSFDDLVAVTDTENVDTETKEDEVEDEVKDDDTDSSKETDVVSDSDTSTDDGDSDKSDKPTEVAVKEDESNPFDKASKDEDTTKDDVESVKKEEEPNYKELVEQILSPFKANGKDIKVDTIEDAIQLMSMGANYNKKMHGLKPNLKLIKMLENNDLLDESKLSFLIDLSKKKPEAIKKLIQDSGLDPLDIDVKEKSEYTPDTYTVDDKEVELDNVLSELQDSKTFERTLDVINNKWDESSKRVLVNDPSIIATIDGHMSSGIYDQIKAAVDNERMLGRLTGLSDIDAYKKVGDLIQKNGGFNKKEATNTPTDVAANKETTDTVKVVKAVPSKDDVKAQKRSASSTNRTTSNSKGKTDDFNPLSLSDEEFSKISSSKYM